MATDTSTDTGAREGRTGTTRPVAFAGIVAGTALTVWLMLDGLRLRIPDLPSLIGDALGAVVIWLIFMAAASVLSELAVRHHRAALKHGWRHGKRGGRAALRHGGATWRAGITRSAPWRGRVTAAMRDRWAARGAEPVLSGPAAADPDPEPAAAGSREPARPKVCAACGNPGGGPLGPLVTFRGDLGDGARLRLIHQAHFEDPATGFYGQPYDHDWPGAPRLVTAGSRGGFPEMDVNAEQLVVTDRSVQDMRRVMGGPIRVHLAGPESQRHAAIAAALERRAADIKSGAVTVPDPETAVRELLAHAAQSRTWAAQTAEGQDGHREHITPTTEGNTMSGTPNVPRDDTHGNPDHPGHPMHGASPAAAPHSGHRVLTIGGAVPGEWKNLVAITADFEPEDDADLITWMASEVNGMSAYAEALTEVYETGVTSLGLDPVSLAALHDTADAAADAAQAMAFARQKFAAHYAEVREYAAAGGLLPHDGRWITGDGE